jgi:hypothetical protein
MHAFLCKIPASDLSHVSQWHYIRTKSGDNQSTVSRLMDVLLFCFQQSATESQINIQHPKDKTITLHFN